MERWEVKLIALVGLLVIPLACTVLPIKVSDYFNRKGEKGKRILSCLMCFGGGVFFAVFMLHMAPEARAIVYHAIEKPNNLRYPVSDLLMSAGFFMVMFVEMVVVAWSRKSQRTASNRKRNSHNPKSVCSDNKFLQTGANIIPLVTTKIPDANGCHSEKHNSDVEDGNCETNDAVIVKKQANGAVPRAAAAPLLGDAATVVVTTDDIDLDTLTPLRPSGHSHGLDTSGEEGLSTRSAVLLLALSLHRIFEGMSVGLQYSVLNVWNLFVAIACHESIIGFSLGLQLVKSRLSVRRILIAAGVCSLFEPVGVAIGTIIVETGDSSPTLDVVNGVLQSIATGTFIYITFFEILQEEISPHDSRLEKLVSVLVGFAVMAALCAVPEEGTLGESPYERFTPHVFNLTTVAGGDITTPTAAPPN